MAGELDDVIGGAIIEASFTNSVKDRTLMRYANAAARDVAIPAPVAGDLAYLQDTTAVVVYDGTLWVELIRLTVADTQYLRLDATNAPVTADLNVSGSLFLSKGNPRVRLQAVDTVAGYDILAVVDDGDTDSGIFINRSDGTNLLGLGGGIINSVRVEQPTDGNGAQGAVRSVSQGTALPDNGDGKDGDVYLQYVVA